MADLLTRKDIDTAMAALPGWAFEDNKLVRSADVPTDSQDGLVEAVMRAADEVNHHPDVSRTQDSVTFRLWTHSVGGVTEKDVDLAARIDAQLSGSATDTGG